MRKNVAQILVSFLEKEGVRHVFGIPGGYNLSFLRELQAQGGVSFVRTQHEGGAAFMADGYARASKKFGCLLTTAGPGATNSITGLISSNADSSPVLSIIGSIPPSRFFMGAIQDTYSYGIDIDSIFNEISRFHAAISSADTFLHYARTAVNYLFKGRKGPVVLNIASDVFQKEIEYASDFDYGYISSGAYFDMEAADMAVETIASSKSLLILAGYGVQLASAEAELLRLAELLNAPVIVTPKGKSSMDNESPLFLGVYGLGANVIPELFIRSEKIDTLLIVGSSLNEYASNVWSDDLVAMPKVVHVDIDPYAIGGILPGSIGVVGDAKAAMRYLCERIERLSHEKIVSLDARQKIGDFRHSHDNLENSAAFESSAIPIKPQRLMKDIHDSFPEENVIVFIDAGQVIWWAGHYLKLRKGWRYHASLGFSSMGFGIPASIGGKFADPTSTVIAIAGDGGAIMNGNELKTAAEYGVPVFVFVINDGRYNIIHHSTMAMYGEPAPGADYREPVDFVRFAEGLGVRAFRVDEPGWINARRMEELKALKAPVLFDCRTDPEEKANISGRIKSVDSGATRDSS